MAYHNRFVVGRRGGEGREYIIDGVLISLEFGQGL